MRENAFESELESQASIYVSALVGSPYQEISFTRSPMSLLLRLGITTQSCKSDGDMPP